MKYLDLIKVLGRAGIAVYMTFLSSASFEGDALTVFPWRTALPSKATRALCRVTGELQLGCGEGFFKESCCPFRFQDLWCAAMHITSSPHCQPGPLGTGVPAFTQLPAPNPSNSPLVALLPEHTLNTLNIIYSTPKFNLVNCLTFDKIL